MKNYLVKLTFQDAECSKETISYCVVCADNTETAELLASSLLSKILYHEHFDANKHGYGYKGYYDTGYFYLIDELK